MLHMVIISPNPIIIGKLLQTYVLWVNHVHKIENQNEEKYEHLKHVFNSSKLLVENSQVMVSVWHAFIMPCGTKTRWLDFDEHKSNT